MAPSVYQLARLQLRLCPRATVCPIGLQGPQSGGTFLLRDHRAQGSSSPLTFTPFYGQAEARNRAVAKPAEWIRVGPLGAVRELFSQPRMSTENKTWL